MFMIICSHCQAKIYSGDEVKSPKQILRLYKGRCKKCDSPLDPEDFSIEVRESS
ncbi:MAG: hypothetical protein JRN39_05640 [Nitrososphaerota archaeon]|nr:hypothetical protein [Nitrososphaerota archaeon]